VGGGERRWPKHVSKCKNDKIKQQKKNVSGKGSNKYKKRVGSKFLIFETPHRHPFLPDSR
jgi:hypothetical protein